MSGVVSLDDLRLYCGLGDESGGATDEVEEPEEMAPEAARPQTSEGSRPDEAVEGAPEAQEPLSAEAEAS